MNFEQAEKQFEDNRGDEEPKCPYCGAENFYDCTINGTRYIACNNCHERWSPEC